MNQKIHESILRVTTSLTESKFAKNFGTAFIFHKDEQATYLLTCAHVVRDVGGKDTVNVGDKKAEVVALGESEKLDLAVLRVTNFLTRPVLKLTAISEYKPDKIQIIGFYQYDDRVHVIEPIEGCLGKWSNIDIGEGESSDGWILDKTKEAELFIQPGYSGSPVIDINNCFAIGVVTHEKGKNSGRCISIHALSKLWPDMPKNLLTQKVIMDEHNKIDSKIEKGQIMDKESFILRLKNGLTENELRILCRKFFIDYNNDLPPGDRVIKVQSLVEYFEKHKRLDQLIKKAQKSHPEVFDE